MYRKFELWKPEKITDVVPKVCSTVEDQEDILRVWELYRRCLMGDKDACEILEEGCGWVNIGKDR